MTSPRNDQHHSSRSRVIERALSLMRSPRFAIPLLFALSIILTLALLWRCRPDSYQRLFADEVRYVEYAKTIVSTGEFGRVPGIPTNRHPPVYPAFLAALTLISDSPPWIALRVQCIICALLAPLAYTIARRIQGDLAGWISGLLCLSYFGLILVTTQFMGDVLAAFFFMISLLVSDHLIEGRPTYRRWALALGGILALLALTRAVMLPLIAVPLLMLAIKSWNQKRKLVESSCIVLVGFALVYGPWIVRNYVTLGRPEILPSKGAQTAALGDLCAKHWAEGDRYIVGRKRAFDILAESDGEFDSIDRFSTQYMHRCATRFAVMLCAHPCLKQSIPFSGHWIRGPKSLPYKKYIHTWDRIWHLTMFAGAFVALGCGLWTRDVRLLNLISMPLAIVVLYSLVHVMIRYQVIPFVGLCVPAGIGLAMFGSAARARWQTTRNRERN